jgi:hypothetical protein
MRRLSLPHGLALSILLSGLVASATVSYAQSKPNNVESVSLRPGTIFEIYADTKSASPQISWVLTKDGTFAQADRGAIFSMRPSEAGMYLLSGEVLDQTNVPVRKMFRIGVRQDIPLIEHASKTEEGLLVRVFPAQDEEGIVRLGSTKRVIRLDAIHNDIELLALDINAEIDSNGDGDTQNDNILLKSIFAEGKGSLHIWLPENLTSQKMLLAGRLLNGSFITQPLHIVSDTYFELLQQQEEAEAIARKERTRIEAIPLAGNSYKLTVVTEDNVLPTDPLLYFWDLGDGTQSLLTSPEHTYAEIDRQYRVSLRIQSLVSGEEVLSSTQMVFVGPPSTPTSPTEPDVTEPKPDTGKKSKGAGSLVSTIIKAVLALAASVGIGMLGVFLFSKLKGKSLRDSLEKAEKKLVGNSADTQTEAPPMEIVTEEDSPEEETEEESPEEEATPAEVVPEKPEVPEETTPEVHRQVPSWLAPAPEEGLEVPATPPAPPAPQAEAVTQAPTPKKVPQEQVPPAEVVPPVQTDAPTPQEPATSPPQKADAPSDAAPPWLAGTEKTTASSPPPPPPAAAAAAAAPAPQEIVQEPTPPQKPEKTDAATPPWLQGTPATTPLPPQSPTPPAAPAQETPTQAATQPAPSAPVQTEGVQETPQAQMSKEELDRERKRKKRQRYRANKRTRERETNEKTPAAQTQETPPVAAPDNKSEQQPAAQAPVPSWLQSTPPPAPTPAAEEKKAEQADAPPAAEAPKQETAEKPQSTEAVPPWLQDTPVSPVKLTEPAPVEKGPESAAQPATEPIPPAAKPVKESAAAPPVPQWLKMTEDTSASQKAESVPEEEEVKFVISADSLEEENAQQMPPSGDIPEQEKQGE